MCCPMPPTRPSPSHAAAAVLGDDADTDWGRIDDLPFESARGFHAVLGRRGRTRTLVVKGAPEMVLPMLRNVAIGRRADRDGR